MEGLKGLKMLRCQKKLTQAELAEKIGIDENTIRRYENGNGFPSSKRLMELQQFFTCSYDELIAGNPTRPPRAAGDEITATA